MTSRLLLLALLPGILIIIFIIKKDKVEKEPPGLIIKLLIFGCLSCIPAIFLENFITPFGPGGQEGDVAYSLYTAFVVAALCEELCKFALLKLGSWRNRNFNYRFDGIVYGTAVAIGFALLENVLYVAQGGISVAISRGLMAVPLHAFCGLFMGIFYGAAKKNSIMKERSKSAGNTFMALFVPFLIHGIYDFLAFMQTNGTMILLLVFVVVMYIIGIKYINKFSREDWCAAFYQEKLSRY